MAQPQSNKVYTDSIGPVPGGVNSQPAPLLLTKEQAAWIINGSNRGAFVQPRAAWIKLNLVFNPPSIQSSFESALYQGSGVYTSDSGVASIISQHGGVLFQITPSGNSWEVTDVSVPGDPNSSTALIAEMNQAELWEIIYDGTSNPPIFFDGTSSRRSKSDTAVVGILSADFAVPAVGSVGTATLNDNFAGQIGDIILLGGFQFRVVDCAGPAVDNITLTNVSDSTGNTYPVGTQVIQNTAAIGTLLKQASIASGVSLPSGTPIPGWFVLDSSLPVLANGTFLTLQASNGLNYGFTVYGNHLVVSPVAGRAYDVSLQQAMTGPISFPVGTIVTRSSGGTTTVIGTLTNGITSSPVPGGFITTLLSTTYVGTPGATVYLGSVGSAQYTIAAIPPPTTTTVCLLNINDPATVTPIVSGSEILSLPELPPGRMGAYGMGHQTQCQTDGISFLYGDTVGGPSGSANFNYRDAVLKTTENTFLNTAGAFRIPSSGQQITSMNFPAVLNAALGQGPLQIGTPFGMFSCLVPTDRATWASLTNPILPQSLVGTGPLNQDGTNGVNSDTIFRSYGGIGSLKLAVQNFQQSITSGSNSSISTEVVRAIANDNTALLQFGSAATFDNRRLTLCNPQQDPQGVVHLGIVAMNLDPLSSLQSKVPACYDGLWTGLKIFKLVTGTFSNVQRLFAFAKVSGKIEIWELLKTGSTPRGDDNFNSIPLVIETSVVFHPEQRAKEERLLRLNNGQIHLQNIFGSVHVKVLWRPEFWPCWVTWSQFDICATGDKPGYFTPFGLGEPPNTSPPESTEHRPFRYGRFFQIRVEITGYAEFMGADFEAVLEPTTKFAHPVKAGEPCQVINCDLPDDYAYSIVEAPPPAPPSLGFLNEAVSTTHQCGNNQVLFVANLPSYISVTAGKNSLYTITISAGQYTGNTQHDANQLALDALVIFVNTALQNGNMACVIN